MPMNSWLVTRRRRSLFSKPGGGGCGLVKSRKTETVKPEKNLRTEEKGAFCLVAFLVQDGWRSRCCCSLDISLFRRHEKEGKRASRFSLAKEGGENGKAILHPVRKSTKEEEEEEEKALSLLDTEMKGRGLAKKRTNDHQQQPRDFRRGSANVDGDDGTLEINQAPP